MEDDPLVRRAAARILRAGGYSVLAASAAPDALELVANHDGPIDALLTDVSMPGLSGDELAAVVLEQRPRMHVLFMSGHSARPLSVVGDAFLQKPFTAAELLGRLDDLFGSGDRRGVGDA